MENYPAVDSAITEHQMQVRSVAGATKLTIVVASLNSPMQATTATTTTSYPSKGALRYQKAQAIVRLKIDEVTRKAVGITNVLMNELDALLYEATNNGQYAILKKICSISNSKVY